MNLHVFFTGSLAAFALLQFWILPQAERHWAANKTRDKIAKTGALAALKSARTLFQIAFVVYGILLGGFWAASWLMGSAADYLSAINVLEDLRNKISFFNKSVMGNLALWTALLGLAYSSFRRHRADLQEQMLSLVQEETERLKAEKERGEWPPLPPTKEMEELAQRIETLRTALSERRNVHQGRKHAARRGKRAYRTENEETMQAARLCEQFEREWIELDFLRRMNLAFETTMDPPGLRRIWPRLVTLFTSKGFARDTGLLAKTCSYVGTAILLLSIVGISAPAINAQMENRIASLWDLQVRASKEEARASWEQARAGPPNQSQPLEAQYVQRLAQTFVHAYLSSAVWQQTTETASHKLIEHEQTLRTAAAREHIVARHIATSPDGLFEKSDYRAARLVRQSLPEPKATTSLEAHFDARLHSEIEGHGADLWNTIKSKVFAYTHAYSEPAKPSEFVKTVLGEVLDPAFEALQPSFVGEHLKQAQKLVTKGFKSAVERSIEMQLERFLADLAGRRTMREAVVAIVKASPESMGLTPKDVEAVRAVTADISEASERLVGYLKPNEAPPSLVRVQRNPENLDAMRKLAEKLVEPHLDKHALETGKVEVPDARMDYLADYEDYSAGKKKGRENTLRTKILADTPFPLKSGQINEAFARSRNFSKLDRFSNVGGVLIGRNPKPSERVMRRIHALQWEPIDKSRLFLMLRDASGGETRLGPYLVDVVYRALLFAADGRPLVVTILNTELGLQKVILHPALVDTRIGCEMIELDKFVFAYLSPDKQTEHEDEMARVRRYDTLYRVAALYGLRSKVKPEYLDDLNKEVKGILTAGRHEINAALLDPILFSDKRRSPLAARYWIYAKPVVNAMESCVKAGRKTTDTFGECMERKGKAFIPPRNEATWRQSCVEAGHINTNEHLDCVRQMEKEESWYPYPKALALVSGVRDAEFNLGADLAFLRGATEKASTWPLYFLIQDSDDRTNRNQDVWRFPSLQKSISQGVDRLIRDDPIAHATLANARDFAVLQRLFRVAFEGQLRAEFPLEQLIALAEYARPRANDVASTDRWRWVSADHSLDRVAATNLKKWLNHMEGSADLSQLIQRVVETARRKLQACSREVEAYAPARTFPAVQWQSTCLFTDKEREVLANACETGEDDTADSAVCNLARAAKYSDGVFNHLKIAEMVGVPNTISAKAERESPRACRANDTNAHQS